MRISDWSSDVCSSDLIEVQAVGDFPLDAEAARRGAPTLLVGLGERRALDVGAAERQCVEGIADAREQREAIGQFVSSPVLDREGGGLGAGQGIGREASRDEVWETV